MTGPLTKLERKKHLYGDGSADTKLLLLDQLQRTRLPSARAVIRLHEVLCFLRAYPDDARVLGRVERMLTRFDRRADLRQHRAALADTGIAGTTIRYRFFWSTARWLTRCWPGQLRFDRSDSDAAEKLRTALQQLVTPAKATWLRDSGITAFAALDRLRGRSLTDASYFVRGVEAMPGDGFTREAFYDAIDASCEFSPRPGTPSRTQAKYAAAPVAFQRGPLRSGRPDLSEQLLRPPRAVRVLSAREGERLLDLARAAMVTRARDLDAFAYGDARDVRLVNDGQSLSFVVNGVVPERRVRQHATYAYLILGNGVPIGYGEAYLTGRSAAVTFNIFETFRGGEAAVLFARMLAMVRHLFGADSFSLDPYQLGKDNEEGIASGAWWFYYKLGFRPRAAQARGILRRELARMKARSKHRSSARTLRKLAEWPLFFVFEPTKKFSG
ncbi:MAG: hypothetical protein ACRES4_00830 [Nevskiales bacterium]